MSHRWKLIIAVAVVMLALTIVWVVTMRVTADSDVEAYKKSLIASGEKLEIAEVMPAPVPAEQNGADILKEAFGLFTLVGENSTNEPPAMRMVAPGRAMACFKQPDVRAYDFTNSWSNQMEAVEGDRPATALLREAMNYPDFDFHIEYAKWPETRFVYLAPLKRSAQRLSAETLCDLHYGDTGSAATNICAMLTLVKSEEHERTLISQLVRIAIAAIATPITWEFLQSTNVNDPELAMVQTNWENLEYPKAMENAILMERAGDDVTIKKMRESSEYLNRMVGGWSGPGSRMGGGTPDFWDEVKLAGAKCMWQMSWTYSDELKMLQNDQVILETLRTMQTNACFYTALTNLQSQMGIGATNTPLEDFIAKIDETGLKQMFSSGTMGVSIVRRVIVAEANKRITTTAIALRRYQLKQGSYPTNLSALVPEFLPAVPLDPMDGKPLRYRLKADGTFLLYSIGDNDTDDGGDASMPGVIGSNYYWLNAHALDWVWPQPATKAEIEYYYARPRR